MAKLTQELVAQHSLRTVSSDCLISEHGDCAITHYKTASPAAYGHMLRTIIRDSSKLDDIEWAKTELVRIQPAIERGSWSVK